MIIRRRLTHDFGMLPNAPFNDPDLSLDAKGLLAYLLLKPNDWKVHVKDIRNSCGVGRDKAYKLLGELCEAGYVVREQRRGKGGRMLPIEYVVLDSPCEAPVPENQEAVEQSADSDAPLPDLPDPAEPDTESPDPVNQDTYKRLTSTKARLGLRTEDVPVGEQDADASAPPRHWGKGSEAFNEICDGLARWRGLDPDKRPPPPKTATMLRTVARQVIQDGGNAEYVTRIAKRWYKDHWAGSDPERPLPKRRPTSKAQMLEWHEECLADGLLSASAELADDEAPDFWEGYDFGTEAPDPWEGAVTSDVLKLPEPQS